MEKGVTIKSLRCAYCTCMIIFHANLTSNAFPYPAKRDNVLLKPLSDQIIQLSAAKSVLYRQDVSRASPPGLRQRMSTVFNTKKSTLMPCTTAQTLSTRPQPCSTTRSRCRTTTTTRDSFTSTGYLHLIPYKAVITTIPRHLRITIHHRTRMTLIAC